MNPATARPVKIATHSFTPIRISDCITGSPKLERLKAAADQCFDARDFTNAFDMYQCIADDLENTDHQSTQRAGSMLLKGEGVTKNFNRGVAYLVKAAELGSTDAVSILKDCLNSLKAPKNDDYLENHLKEIVSIVLSGNNDGIMALGRWVADYKTHLTGVFCHLEGLATAGNYKAAKILGEWFISSKIPALGNCAINALKATAKDSPSEGHYLLGRVYLLSGNGTAAIEQLELAYKCRNTDAMLLLGKIYGLEFCTPIYKPVHETHPYPLRRDAINNTLTKATAVLVADNKAKCGLTKSIAEANWNLAAHCLQAAVEIGGNVEAAFLYGVALTKQGNTSQAKQYIQFAIDRNYAEALSWYGWKTNNQELLGRASQQNKELSIFFLCWGFAHPKMSDADERRWISDIGYCFAEYLDCKPTYDSKMVDPELFFLVAAAVGRVHNLGSWRHKILLDAASAGGSFNARLWLAELYAEENNETMAKKYLRLADDCQARSSSQDNSDRKEKMGRIMAMHQKYPSIFGDVPGAAGFASQINDTTTKIVLTS